MLISFDLGGADWVTTAFCCRDPAMLEVARNKQSPHAITGARITNLSIEEVMAEHKLIGNKNDPMEIEYLRREHLPHIFQKASFLPRTMSIRQCAKKANHGLNFRLGYKTYALKNEIEEREAAKVVQLYRQRAYPGLNDWYDVLDETIRKTRTLVNCFGRKVYFQGALNDETFREATSFIPQSTTFDVCAVAMKKYVEDDSAEFRPARMVAQVHDSLMFDYPNDRPLAAAQFCKRLALDYMSPTLSYHGESYVLDVAMKAGHTWGGMKDIDIQLPVEELADKLAQISVSKPLAA